jgi:hypothetical protein
MFGETVNDILRGSRRRLYQGTIFYENGSRFMADSACKCAGRGHIGRDVKKNSFIPCSCLIKSELDLGFIILGGD